MTTKQEFLEKLRAALVERGISDTDIDPYIERFDRFFDRMVSDPDTDRSDMLADTETIADNIAAQISERYDEINRLAERTMTVDRIRTEDVDLPDTTAASVTSAATATSAATDGPEPAAPDGVPTESPPPPPATAQKAPEPASAGTRSPSEPPPGMRPVPEPVPDEPEKRLPDYIDAEPAPNSTVFWVLFAVSLPVTIPLGAAAILLFIAVWGGLAALILSSIAALIVTAAGGTAISLVGIIYGVTKLFSVMPVGLYEIGLGVLVGGCVMFAAILLYNFAVRLLPLVIKLVARLFRYLYSQLKVLFVFLRKECAKL